MQIQNYKLTYYKTHFHTHQVLLNLLRTADLQSFIFSKQIFWEFLKFQQNKLCDTLKGHQLDRMPKKDAEIDLLAEKIAEIDVSDEIEDFYFIEHNGTFAPEHSFTATYFSNGCFICNQKFNTTEHLERHFDRIHGENFKFFVLKQMMRFW
jgi:hypothetical protein